MSTTIDMRCWLPWSIAPMPVMKLASTSPLNCGTGKICSPLNSITSLTESSTRLATLTITATLRLSYAARSRPNFGRKSMMGTDPVEPVVRYEHDAPGDMLHIDTKKLGRIERPSHRVTGNRRDTIDGAGWEMLFVAILTLHS
jgi:hypothetical protein